MAKKLFLILICILFLLAGGYFLRYKTSPSFNRLIPQNAKSVICIDVRKIEQLFIHDIIKNPWSYFTDNSSKATDSLSHQEKSVKWGDLYKLPRSLLLYSEDSQQHTWQSTPIKIKNKDSLHSYYVDNGYKVRNDEAGMLYSRGYNHVLLVDNLARFFIGKWDYQNIFSSFSNTNSSFMNEDHPVLRKIIETTSIITYVSGKNQFLEAFAEGEEIIIKGNFIIPFLLPSTRTIVDTEDSRISAHFDKNSLSTIITQDMRDNFMNFTKINTDSILHFWNGNIQANIKDQRTFLDTIVTYDYDDDFNRIAVQKIEERSKPDFVAKIGIDSGGWEYLYKKKAIIDENKQEILAVFPLVKTIVKRKDNGILLTTNKNYNIHTAPSKLKLDAYLDFRALNISFPDMPFLEHINSINAKVDNYDNIEISVRTEENKNAFLNFFSAN